MKRDLAQKLLSSVLDWGPEEVEKYRELLDDFSELKYDMYQQYKPGSRFVENLSIWLNQFDEKEERRIALMFILRNLVFISPDEMQHLICTAYPDIILPILKKDARNISKTQLEPQNKEDTKKILQLLIRQSLFLGLSDGARIDMFRRSNPELSNEQICISYEIPDTKFADILKELKKDTNKITSKVKINNHDSNTIKNIFLLDDFSGSGISYLRKEEGQWKGKISKVIKCLKEQKVKLDGVSIYVILYLATEKSIKNIKKSFKQFEQDEKIRLDIKFVQLVEPITLSKEEIKIFKKYYSNSIEDIHYLKGKHDNPHLGFDECALSLILYHNAPNNSFPILWSGKHALFPRVTRHKDVN